MTFRFSYDHLLCLQEKDNDRLAMQHIVTSCAKEVDSQGRVATTPLSSAMVKAKLLEIFKRPGRSFAFQGSFLLSLDVHCITMVRKYVIFNIYTLSDYFNNFIKFTD